MQLFKTPKQWNGLRIIKNKIDARITRRGHQKQVNTTASPPPPSPHPSVVLLRACVVEAKKESARRHAVLPSISRRYSLCTRACEFTAVAYWFRIVCTFSCLHWDKGSNSGYLYAVSSFTLRYHPLYFRSLDVLRFWVLGSWFRSGFYFLANSGTRASNSGYLYAVPSSVLRY